MQQQLPSTLLPLPLEVPPGAVFRICRCWKVAVTVSFGIRWPRPWTLTYSLTSTSTRRCWRRTRLTPRGSRPSSPPMSALRLSVVLGPIRVFRSAKNTSTGPRPLGPTGSALSPEIELAATIMISRRPRRAIGGSISDSIYLEPSTIVRSAPWLSWFRSKFSPSERPKDLN